MYGLGPPPMSVKKSFSEMTPKTWPAPSTTGTPEMPLRSRGLAHFRQGSVGAHGKTSRVMSSRAVTSRLWRSRAWR